MAKTRLTFFVVLFLIQLSGISQGTFECPDTLFIEIPAQVCEWEVADYSYLSSPEAGDTFLQSPASGSTMDINEAWDYEITLTLIATDMSETECSFIARVAPEQVDPEPNVWTASCYNGKKIYNNGVYRGAYSSPDLNIVSWWLWDTGLSPSAYDEYQGCTVNNNQHTVSYTRSGFPCAPYALDILNHDNEVQVFVDGNLVFEDFGFNLQHYSVYEGFLDENSTVTFEWNEGIGGSLGILDFRMLCPNDTVIALDENCSASMPDFRHSPCNGGSVSQSIQPGSDLNPGVFPVTIYTSDINGQQDSCTFNVEVLDETPPVLDCPESIELVANQNCEVVVPDFSSLEGMDNCSGPTEVSQNMAPGTTISGDTSITISTADPSGNQTECEVEIILIDNEAPTYPCPEDDVILVNEDCSWILPNYTFMRFPEDNCSSDFSVSQFPSPGTMYNDSQVIEVEIVIVDLSGNQTICNFSVAAYDQNTPVLECPVDQTITVGNMCDVELPDFTSQITYSGTCNEVELIQTPIAGTPISESGEITEIEIQALSSNGLSAYCSFNFTVIDDQMVDFSCEDTFLFADSNCQAIVPNLTGNVSIENECTQPHVVQFPAAGTVLSISDSPVNVTFTVTDEAGNGSTCGSILTIIDNTAPTLSCPEEAILAYVDENGSYQIENYSSEVDVQESCSSPVDIEQSPAIETSVGLLGIQQIDISATDAAGNSSECALQVEVLDTISPSIQILVEPQIVLDANCGFVLPDLSSFFDFGDNHSEELTITQSTSAGTYFEAAVTDLFQIQVEDESGNSSSLQIELQYLDQTPPEIDCPEDIDIYLNESCSASMPNMTEMVLGTDNCNDNLSYIQSIEAGIELTQENWPSVVLVEVSDASMNTSQCTIGLLAVDSIAPQISCPDGGDFNINTDCLAELNLGVPEVSDYCSDVDFILLEGPEINGSFEVGEYESVFQAEDAFGNTATCNVVFSVFDVIAPEINCAPPTEISLDVNCEIEAINMSPEAFDSCSETSWIQTSGPEPGAWIGAGIYDLLFTASDASGNQAECSTQLTVVDVSAPVIVCPPNQQLNALEDLCGTYLEYELEVSDNCSYNVDQLDGELSGAFLTLGNHSFAFEVSDPSGNTSTCSFQVEVIDNTPPLIDCVETIYISHPSETISLPQATDACGLVEVSAVGIWPPNYPLVSGNTSFEFIAVDDAGNLSTCLTSVQVNSAPIARTDRVNSFRRTETIHVLNNDEDPDGPYVLLNPGEYPDYVQQNIDDSFTLYLEDLDCVADTFTYQIRDIDGLTATGMVIIQPTCPYSIELPQIITPNGDGMNDLFVIENLANFQENELQVFNETGQRVYHKYNYQNSWDGRGEGIGSFGSGRLPQGTYYVILHLASQERPIKGALTIVY